MIIDIFYVEKNENIAKDTFKMEIIGNFNKADFKPGQFINIKIGKGKEFLLRRPISICEINSKNKITIIYKINGEGTKRLSKLQKGDEIDIILSLGNGYDLNSLDRGCALLIGGGIGIPPLYELSKQFNKKGIKTIHILGFNTKDEIFYEKEFLNLGETYITTVDGSYGSKGFVTDMIDSLYQNKEFYFDKYYSCGPIPMLKALSEKLKEKEGYISLENRMACGVGACYACVCKKKNNNKDTKQNYTRVCYDGPVYEVGTVELK